MRFDKITIMKITLGALVMVFMLGLVYQLPPVQRRLAWRVDALMTGLRTSANPVGQLPTPLPVVSEQILDTPTPTATAQPTVIPLASATPFDTPTPTPSPTPLPGSVRLPSPRWEAQDWNNCGPAALALHLRFFGWEGDQFTISDIIKPIRADRNVNIDELLVYVYTYVPQLGVEYRVGGTIDLIRSYLAAGLPVMIEAGTLLDEPFWNQDDLWAGHYLLVTGYDDASQTFVVQDTYRSADLKMSYQELDATWQTFNRVYFVLFPFDQQEMVQRLIGDNLIYRQNRQNALDTAITETRTDPTNPFPWFNKGTNLVYFERYHEAIDAYNTARQLGLPQRMLRYQFGPFLAYFHGGRNDELLALTEYALQVTPNSEEALLWRGWALYRAGKSKEALEHFYQALEARPGYTDALYAVRFVQEN
jgi:tetratricopeptide (TPR) repeat protein